MIIRIGLNSYKVARLEKDTSAAGAEDGKAVVSYKEVLTMPDVQNIDLTARSQSTDVDADDITTTLTKCSGYDGKVQRTAFTPEEQALLLGETILEDGTVISGSDDEAPEYATGFCCPLYGGKVLAVWILRCKYSGGDLSAETGGTEKLNPQSDSLSFKSSARSADKKWRVYKLCENETEAEKFLQLDTINKIYEKNGSNPPDEGTPSTEDNPSGQAE